MLCKDFSCTVSSHTSDLDMCYQNIIDACVLATKDAIPYRSFSKPQDKHTHLTGWTTELNLAREQSSFWHFIWVACERPREGEVESRRTVTSLYDVPSAMHSCVTPLETIGLKVRRFTKINSRFKIG